MLVLSTLDTQGSIILYFFLSKASSYQFSFSPVAIFLLREGEPIRALLSNLIVSLQATACLGYGMK